MSQYSEWFKQLQDDIVATVESLDSTMEERVAPTREGWTQSHKTIKSTVFEKGTVNFSEVTGEFDTKFAKEIPGAPLLPSTAYIIPPNVEVVSAFNVSATPCWSTKNLK